MKASIDRLGRIVVPKPLRDALGLSPGSSVDISRHGAGLQLIPEGRTARLHHLADGGVVAESSMEVTDETLFGLLDDGRR